MRFFNFKSLYVWASLAAPHLAFLPKWLNVIVVIVFAVSLGSCGGSSNNNSNPAESPTPPLIVEPIVEYQSLEEELNAYLVGGVPSGEAGVAVLVMENGAVKYHGGRGLANKSAGIDITTRTGFRVASISKSFTALAIMQLVESGRIKVSDSVREYIPELSQTWQNITIEQLLTHQSGIPDVLTPFSFINGLTNNEAIAYYATHPSLSFTPGSRTSYSNTNYVLLAEVIERATGYRFGDYLRLFIFDVAGMEDSYVDDELVPLRAGDALNFADRIRYYSDLTVHLVGNMGQVSSTQDFIGFFTALKSGLLVSEETLALMTEPRGQLFGGNYGYGLMLSADTYGHGGLFDGFRTEMTIKPDANLEFVILTNGGSRTQGYVGEIRSIIYRWEGK